MDIGGVVEAMTSELKEMTIGRGVSIEVTIGEAKPVVITKYVGSIISIGKSELVITIKSAVKELEEQAKFIPTR